MSHLMDTAAPWPLVFDKGMNAGICLVGAQRSHLDFFCDSGAASLGYNSTEQVQMLKGFLYKGVPIHCPNILRHQLRESTADLVCQALGMDKVFFCNSGSEAVEASIKLARAHTGRTTIWSQRDGFHGRTYGALAASDGPPYHTDGFGPMLEGFGHFNDPDEVSWSDAAAVLLSPVFVNHDLRFDDALLDRLRERCDAHGVLLIFDEVQTGMGRCGGFSYAQVAAIKPDIVAIAKGAAMGYPLGACLARGPVAEAFTPGTHFSTFGGNPLGCWALTMMTHWIKDHRAEIDAKGGVLSAMLCERGLTHRVWGKGLLIGLHLNVDRLEFKEECFKRGLIVGAFRSGPGTIKLTPPLNIGYNEMERGVGIMEDALETVREACW